MISIYTIVILSIILIIVTIILLLFRNNQLIIKLENNIKKVSNILTFSSVLLSIIAILITGIITIATEKKAKVDIDFYTDHGCLYREESNEKELYLLKGENNTVEEPITIPCEWRIRLSNSGNIATNNMMVKIQFEGIYFVKELIDSPYKVCNHIYGQGGYEAIEYKYEENIYPNDYIQLPNIPFEDMLLEEDNTDNKVTMKITIYDENANSKTNKYKILLKEKEI